MPTLNMTGNNKLFMSTLFGIDGILGCSACLPRTLSHLEMDPDMKPACQDAEAFI